MSYSNKLSSRCWQKKSFPTYLQSKILTENLDKRSDFTNYMLYIGYQSILFHTYLSLDLNTFYYCFCYTLQGNKLPRTLYLQADNCWRENKNKWGSFLFGAPGCEKHFQRGNYCILYLHTAILWIHLIQSYSIPKLLYLSVVISPQFQTSPKLHDKSKPNFVLSLYGWGTKIWVTWPRWTPCPYMVKNFRNLRLNQLTDYFPISEGAPYYVPIFEKISLFGNHRSPNQTSRIFYFV